MSEKMPVRIVPMTADHLDAVAALNISTVISNLFNVVFVAMGSAVSIIVGQLLGAGKMEEAKDTDR